MFEDDKITDLGFHFGPLGEVVYIRLLCLVYRNGYYYRFTTLDSLALLVAKSIGTQWARGTKTVTEVISHCAKIKLFEESLVRQGILTSRRIQLQFLKASGRRRNYSRDQYWLVDQDDEPLSNMPTENINVDNNGVIVCNNSINVDNKYGKKKERKEKINRYIHFFLSDVKLSTVSEKPVDKFHFISFKKRCDLILKEYGRICSELKQIKKIDSVIYNFLKDGSKIYKLSDYIKAFEKTISSNFLKNHVKGWDTTFKWIINPDHMNDILSGKYDNYIIPAGDKLPKNGSGVTKSPIKTGASFDTDDFFQLALNRSEKLIKQNTGDT